MANPISFTVTKDTLSPSLARLAALGKNPTPVMRAMGRKFQTITKSTFNSSGAGNRPTPWPTKSDGNASNLRKTGTLFQSINLDQVTATSARVSTGVKYARIHQLGGEIVPKSAPYLCFRIGDRFVKTKKVTMPARPFFPVVNGQLTPSAEEQIRKAGERVIEKQAGE